MKSTGSLLAVAAFLGTALMALDPMTSGAADSVPVSRLETVSGPRSEAQSCPKEKPSTGTDCATAGGERTIKTGNAPRNQPAHHQGSAKQSDAAGALLEELMNVADH